MPLDQDHCPRSPFPADHHPAATLVAGQVDPVATDCLPGSRQPSARRYRYTPPPMLQPFSRGFHLPVTPVFADLSCPTPHWKMLQVRESRMSGGQVRRLHTSSKCDSEPCHVDPFLNRTTRAHSDFIQYRLRCPLLWSATTRPLIANEKALPPDPVWARSGGRMLLAATIVSLRRYRR
jgi:hypothetical protein